MKIECTPNELSAAGDEFLRLHARRQERGWSIMKLMIAAGLNPHSKLGNAMVGLPDTLAYRGAKFTYIVMSAAVYELQGIPRGEWEQQERRLGGNHLVAPAIPPEGVMAAKGFFFIGQGDIDRTDRFLVRAARRPGNAGDRKSQVRAGKLSDPLRHEPGCLFTDGPVLFKNCRGDSQQIRFCGIAVGDYAALQKDGTAGSDCILVYSLYRGRQG